MIVVLLHLPVTEAADPRLQQLIGRRYTGLKDFPVLMILRTLEISWWKGKKIFEGGTFHRLFVFAKNTGLLILMRYVPGNTGNVIYLPT